MQGRLTKFRILFYCLLDGGQFKVSRCKGILVVLPRQSYNIDVM